ncbi:DUF222 domain-containing protein [Arthrobacter sp. 754]|uniref:HNH endonuclease signature motif containing protein n=1 Tax=Arthrobacter sp. 754 TaxID=3156315 RepID=UPI003397DCA2
MESMTADEVLERIMPSAAAPGIAPVTALGSAPAHASASLDGGAGDGCARGNEPDESDPMGESDPMRRRKDLCLDRLAGIARLEARTAAEKVRILAELLVVSTALEAPAQSPQEATAQEMALIAEVACALTVGERTASTLLTESLELTTALPLTLAALQAGAISWQHARVMVDETTNLDASAAKALEAHFLDPGAENPNRGCPAGELVPSRFRHKARIWRERHHPVSIEERHTRSVADRRLEYRPDRDGMAWLSAYLPADQAAGIWNRTTADARALQGPDEDRTMTQRRADIAATLLLCGDADTLLSGGDGDNLTGGSGGAGEMASQTGGGGAGRVPSPRALVLVTVPIMSLLGATDEPAMLDGFGPIPVTMARRLIADGATSFHRVLIDPRDGAPLEIGRTSYPVTKAQRQWLRMRDGKCPFPGCHNQSLDNEADHLLAWAHGGTTGITNLAQPCPKHHKLRHTGGWTPGPATHHEPPGWISPTGRRYASEQPDWEPPHWPEDLLEDLQVPVPEDWRALTTVGWDPPGCDEPLDDLSEHGLT